MSVKHPNTSQAPRYQSSTQMPLLLPRTLPTYSEVVASDKDRLCRHRVLSRDDRRRRRRRTDVDEHRTGYDEVEVLAHVTFSQDDSVSMRAERIDYSGTYPGGSHVSEDP